MKPNWKPGKRPKSKANASKSNKKVLPTSLEEKTGNMAEVPLVPHRRRKEA